MGPLPEADSAADGSQQLPVEGPEGPGRSLDFFLRHLRVKAFFNLQKSVNGRYD